MNVLSTILEIAGLIAVCVAAWSVAPALGMFAAGVCLLAVGLSMES